MRNNQKNFIEAYVWLFGGTKKAENDYISLIIESYAKQNRLAFWED